MDDQSLLALFIGEHGWGGNFLLGAVMTLALAFTSYAVGLVLGLIGAAAKLRGGRAQRAMADAYTTITRSVPDLLLVLFIFYAGPELIRGVLRSIGISAQVEIPAFASAVIALSFVIGGYATEVLRGAILAIPSGPIEAGVALGMRRSLVFRLIIWPLSLRYALPGLRNIWLVTTRETSLASIVSISEIMHVAKQAAGATKHYFLFYCVAAACYLLISLLSTKLFSKLEHRY